MIFILFQREIFIHQKIHLVPTVNAEAVNPEYELFNFVIHFLQLN